MGLKVDTSAFNKLVGGMIKEKDNLFVSREESAISEKIALNSPNLNYLFGGGINYSRIHQVYGPEHSGKTSLISAIVGDVQHKVSKIYPGKDIVIWMDFERTFDMEYGRKLGLDTSEGKFYLMQPDTGEEAFEYVKRLIKTGAVAAVVLDSDAMMPTAAELTGDEVGKATYGGQAKLLAIALRQINILCSNYKTLYFQISQERVDPTIRSSYGVVKKATGGDAIKFDATTRTRIKKIEDVKNTNGDTVGIRVQVRNIKNKSGGGALPFRTVELVLDFNKGFDTEAEYKDMIIKLSNDIPGLSHPNNRTYMSDKYNFKCTSRGDFEEYLDSHPNILEALKKEVDIFFTKSTSLDAYNTIVDEGSDGIEIEPLPSPETLAQQALNAASPSPKEEDTEEDIKIED